MAKQTGIMQLEGTVGNVTFYKSKDGHFARQKSRPKGNSSERTQENMKEFAQAAKGGKLVRKAFATIINDVKDSFLVRRLSKEMAAVLKADSLSPRGMRNITDGDIELLQGFELNSNMALSTVLKAPYATEINRITGVLKVNIPPFVPAKLITIPEGATHLGPYNLHVNYILHF